MEDNIHPVVELLLARMESNPEEFQFQANSSYAVTGRWETWISQLGWHFNEAEKELIYGKAKELIFQRVHEEVLDELLNGEERRAEAERSLMTVNRMANSASQVAAIATLGQYQNALGISTVTTANSIQLGNERLDEGTLTKIKKALGL